MAVWAEVVSLRKRQELAWKMFRKFPRELFSFDEGRNRKELVVFTLVALTTAIFAGISWLANSELSDRPSVYIVGTVLACFMGAFSLFLASLGFVAWRADRKFRKASKTREFARWWEADQLKSTAEASAAQTLRDAYWGWLESYGISKDSILSDTVNGFPGSADSRIVGVIQYRNVGEAVRAVSVEFHEGDLALFDSEGAMLEPVSPFVFPAVSEDFIRFERLVSGEPAEPKRVPAETTVEDLFALMLGK